MSKVVPLNAIKDDPYVKRTELNKMAYDATSLPKLASDITFIKGVVIDIPNRLTTIEEKQEVLNEYQAALFKRMDKILTEIDIISIHLAEVMEAVK